MPKLNELLEAIKNGDLGQVKVIFEDDVVNPEHHLDYPGEFKGSSQEMPPKKQPQESSQTKNKEMALINSKDKLGKTPLHIALEQGKDNIAELLIEKGADVNLVDKNRVTPLHIAVQNNNIDIAELLIENGANVNVVDNKNQATPLHYALHYKNIPIAKLLIENGANVNSVTENGTTPLHIAVQNNDIEIAKLLIEKGAHVNVVDNKSQATPLHYALHYKYTPIAKLLIENGANVNSVTENGTTPLHIAVQNNNIDIAKLLIEKGAYVRDIDAFKQYFIVTEEESEQENNYIGRLLNNLKEVDNQKEYKLHYLVQHYGLDALRVFLQKYQKSRLDEKDNNGNTPLHIALEQGKDNIAELLIEKGVNFNVVDKDGVTPLHIALRDKNYDIAKLLIEKGASFNVADKNRVTPLHIAVQNNAIEIIKLLIKKDADINAVDKNNITPLHIAVQNNDIEIAKLLIEKGADVNAVNDNHGATPLHIALAQGKDNIAELLIEKVADVNAVDKNRVTPLHYALHNKIREIAKLLIEKGAHVNVVDKSRVTPLHIAVQNNDIEIAKLLIEKGADVRDIDAFKQYFKVTEEKSKQENNYIGRLLNNLEEVDNQKEYKLHYLVQHYGLDALRVFLQKYQKSRLDEKDNHGNTPLHVALILSKFDIAKLLIENGANVNSVTENGTTPLHIAVQNNAIEIIKLLIKKDADINAVNDNNGATPLHIAVQNNNIDIAKLLIEKGVNFNVVDNNGNTPLHIALRDKNYDIAKLLIENGASFNVADKNRVTPLHIAVQNNAIEIIKLLIKKDADINAVDKNNITPLHIALRDKNYDIAKLLIAKGAKVLNITDLKSLYENEENPEHKFSFGIFLISAYKKKIVENEEEIKEIRKEIANGVTRYFRKGIHDESEFQILFKLCKKNEINIDKFDEKNTRHQSGIFKAPILSPFFDAKKSTSNSTVEEDPGLHKRNRLSLLLKRNRLSLLLSGAAAAGISLGFYDKIKALIDNKYIKGIKKGLGQFMLAVATFIGLFALWTLIKKLLVTLNTSQQQTSGSAAQQPSNFPTVNPQRSTKAKLDPVYHNKDYTHIHLGKNCNKLRQMLVEFEQSPNEKKAITAKYNGYLKDLYNKNKKVEDFMDYGLNYLHRNRNNLTKDNIVKAEEIYNHLKKYYSNFGLDYRVKEIKKAMDVSKGCIKEFEEITSKPILLSDVKRIIELYEIIKVYDKYYFYNAATAENLSYAAAGEPVENNLDKLKAKLAPLSEFFGLKDQELNEAIKQVKNKSSNIGSWTKLIRNKKVKEYEEKYNALGDNKKDLFNSLNNQSTLEEYTAVLINCLVAENIELERDRLFGSISAMQSSRVSLSEVVAALKAHAKIYNKSYAEHIPLIEKIILSDDIQTIYGHIVENEELIPIAPMLLKGLINQNEYLGSDNLNNFLKFSELLFKYNLQDVLYKYDNGKSQPGVALLFDTDEHLTADVINAYYDIFHAFPIDEITNSEDREFIKVLKLELVNRRNVFADEVKHENKSIKTKNSESQILLMALRLCSEYKNYENIDACKFWVKDKEYTATPEKDVIDELADFAKTEDLNDKLFNSAISQIINELDVLGKGSLAYNNKLEEVLLRNNEDKFKDHLLVKIGDQGNDLYIKFINLSKKEEIKNLLDINDEMKPEDYKTNILKAGNHKLALLDYYISYAKLHKKKDLETQIKNLIYNEDNTVIAKYIEDTMQNQKINKNMIQLIKSRMPKLENGAGAYLKSIYDIEQSLNPEYEEQKASGMYKSDKIKLLMDKIIENDKKDLYEIWKDLNDSLSDVNEKVLNVSKDMGYDDYHKKLFAFMNKESDYETRVKLVDYYVAYARSIGNTDLAKEIATEYVYVYFVKYSIVVERNLEGCEQHIKDLNELLDDNNSDEDRERAERFIQAVEKQLKLWPEFSNIQGDLDKLQEHISEREKLSNVDKEFLKVYRDMKYDDYHKKVIDFIEVKSDYETQVKLVDYYISYAKTINTNLAKKIAKIHYLLIYKYQYSIILLDPNLDDYKKHLKDLNKLLDENNNDKKKANENREKAKRFIQVIEKQQKLGLEFLNSNPELSEAIKKLKGRLWPSILKKSTGINAIWEELNYSLSDDNKKFLILDKVDTEEKYSDMEYNDYHQKLLDFMAKETDYETQVKLVDYYVAYARSIGKDNLAKEIATEYVLIYNSKYGVSVSHQNLDGYNEHIKDLNKLLDENTDENSERAKRFIQVIEKQQKLDPEFLNSNLELSEAIKKLKCRLSPSILKNGNSSSGAKKKVQFVIPEYDCIGLGLPPASNLAQEQPVPAPGPSADGDNKEVKSPGPGSGQGS